MSQPWTRGDLLAAAQVALGFMGILVAILIAWRAERKAAHDGPRTSRSSSPIRARVVAATFPAPPPNRRLRWVLVALTASGLVVAGIGLVGLLGPAPGVPVKPTAAVGPARPREAAAPLAAAPEEAAHAPPEQKPEPIRTPVHDGVPADAVVRHATPAPVQRPRPATEARFDPVVATPAPADPLQSLLGPATPTSRPTRAQLWPMPGAPDGSPVDPSVTNASKRIEGPFVWGMEAEDVRIVAQANGVYSVRFDLKSESRPRLRLPKLSERMQIASFGPYMANPGDGRFVTPDNRLACRSTSASLGEWEKPPLRVVGRNTLRVRYTLKCEKPFASWTNLRFIATLDHPAASGSVMLNVGAAISDP